MFARLDDWLIKRFEPIAHWIAHNTGASNFTVAMALLVVWPATVGADAIAKQTAMDWTMAGVCLIVATGRYAILAILERRRARNAALGFLDDRVCAYWWRCVENVIVTLILLVVPIRLFGMDKAPLSINDIGTAAVWAHLYFAACSQPPPREWRQPKLATQGA